MALPPKEEAQWAREEMKTDDDCRTAVADSLRSGALSTRVLTMKTSGIKKNSKTKTKQKTILGDPEELSECHAQMHQNAVSRARGPGFGSNTAGALALTHC